MEEEVYPRFFCMSLEQEKKWTEASPEVREKEKNLLDNHIKHVEKVIAIRTIRRLNLQREFVEYLCVEPPMDSIYHAVIGFVNKLNENIKNCEDKK